MLDYDKKTIAIACAVVLFVCWYVFGSRDNSGRIEQVRDNIQSVGAEQQRAISEVRQSQRIVETIRESVASADLEITDSRTISNDSASLISEGKRIVEQARSRNNQ